MKRGGDDAPVVLTEGQSWTGVFCGGAKASDAANRLRVKMLIGPVYNGPVQWS